MAQNPLAPHSEQTFPYVWTSRHCISVALYGQVVDISQVNYHRWMHTVMYYHRIGIQVQAVFPVFVMFMTKTGRSLMECSSVTLFVGCGQSNPSFSRIYTPQWALDAYLPPEYPLRRSD